MADVALVHWKKAELPERVARLEAAGHTVRGLHQEGGEAFRRIEPRPPDVVVIDLGRLPSHGRSTAMTLRTTRATRHLPLVFVDGAEDEVARVRADFPDAVFTPWSRIRSAVRKALAHPPREPAAPARSAGDPGTPLPRKLGVRAGHVLMLVGAPAGFEKTLGPLPGDVTLRRQARGRADLVLCFVRRRAELEKRLAGLPDRLADKGQLWVCWPKQASGEATDLKSGDVRSLGLAAGLVDTKVCAVDGTWSGLRFSRRRS